MGMGTEERVDNLWPTTKTTYARLYGFVFLRTELIENSFGFQIVYTGVLDLDGVGNF